MITSGGQIVKVHINLKLDTSTMVYLKMEKSLKDYQYILVDQNTWENLKIISRTDMGPLYGQMVINILENGKMVKLMEEELKHGKMEENI